MKMGKREREGNSMGEDAPYSYSFCFFWFGGEYSAGVSHARARDGEIAYI
jgi:hypothetical protein